jgi:hypothetical protein
MDANPTPFSHLLGEVPIQGAGDSTNMKELHSEVKRILEEFFFLYKGPNMVVQRYGHVTVSNQRMNTKDLEGRRKFAGKETISLKITRPNRNDVVLARLVEEDDGSLTFYDVALAEYASWLPDKWKLGST